MINKYENLALNDKNNKSKENNTFKKSYSTLLENNEINPINQVHKCNEMLIAEDNKTLIKKYID